MHLLINVTLRKETKFEHLYLSQFSATRTLLHRLNEVTFTPRSKVKNTAG